MSASPPLTRLPLLAPSRGTRWVPLSTAQTVGGELVEELVERGGRPHEVLSALAREVAAAPTVLVL